jgi:hydrogenase maturation protease
VILCIAIGNSLRGDDGVAHRVLELIHLDGQVSLRNVTQLTPELAPEIGGFRQVLFIDADLRYAEPHLESIVARLPPNSALAHVMTPSQLVALAQHLYGFSGDALVCHVPAMSFGYGEQLSPMAKAGAAKAAECLRQFLSQ